MLSTMTALIIGYGAMGKIHAEKISKIPTFGQIVVVDTNERRLEEACSVNYSAYGDLDSAYQKHKNFDVVVVTTNTAKHFECIEQILLKCEKEKLPFPALFVEKPIVATEDEAKKVQDLLTKFGYPSKQAFMCGYLLRESPAVSRLIEKVLEDNETISSIKITWQKQRKPSRASAGVIQDETTHSLDLIRYILRALLKVNHDARDLKIRSTTRTRDIVDTVEQDLIYLPSNENRIPFAEVNYTLSLGNVNVEGFSSFLRAPQERTIQFTGKNKTYTLIFDKDGQDFCDTEPFKIDKIGASWKSFSEEIQFSKKPPHTASVSEVCDDVELTTLLEEKAKIFLQSLMFSDKHLLEEKPVEELSRNQKSQDTGNKLIQN